MHPDALEDRFGRRDRAFDPAALGARKIFGLERSWKLKTALEQSDIAALLDEHQPDFVACSLEFDRWCAENIKPWFTDHVYWDAELIRRWSGHDIDLTRPLPSDLIMAATEVDPEMRKVVGPYMAMRELPASLATVEPRARAIYASGWRPPVPEGPTRDELVELITATVAQRVSA